MDKQHLDTTLAVTQAMADELTDYLMGDSLYRQLVVKIPTGTKQPKMTIGALLENLELLRWDKESLSTGQQKALAAIEQKIDLDRSAFAQQWQAHLRRELKGLLELLAMVPGRGRQQSERAGELCQRGAHPHAYRSGDARPGR